MASERVFSQPGRCSTCAWWTYAWTNEPPPWDFQLWDYTRMQCRKKSPELRDRGDPAPIWPETGPKHGCGDHKELRR